MQNRRLTVPGSDGTGDLTLTVHAPAVELSDSQGGTITIGAHQIGQLTEELLDLDGFFDTGES